MEYFIYDHSTNSFHDAVRLRTDYQRYMTVNMNILDSMLHSLITIYDIPGGSLAGTGV